MTTIQVCSFCQKPCFPGKGMVFVRNDGTVFRFCTSKCNKNFKMKREPRKVKWTEAYRAVHGKLLIDDPAMEIEKRRMRAVKYDRDLWERTQLAMDKLDKIILERRIRHKVARKRAEAIKMLSSKRAAELGLHAETQVPIPDLDKMKGRARELKLRVRASVVAKHRLKKVAQKIEEVE